MRTSLGHRRFRAAGSGSCVWKARIGVDLDDIADRQNDVRESFCYFLVGLEGAPFAVADAAVDPRTKDHPSVAPMKIGAWAGYPVLGSAGEVLGSMCVIDDVPHEWDERELRSLATLARAVSIEVGLRQALRSTHETLAEVADLASSLQESLLPPSLTPVPGLDCAASYLPASGGAVVGDFYDLFQTEGARWATFIGDVCGHGVEAAKATSLARYTLRAEAMQERSPAAVLAGLNAALLAQQDDGRFVTALYATFELDGTRVIGELCAAGHPPALIRRADGGVEPLGGPGTLLGVLDEVDLHNSPFELEPGDLLLLYTDGAIEARSACSGDVSRAEYGEKKLAASLAQCPGISAAEVVACLTGAIVEHADGSVEDDIALLALRVPAEIGGDPREGLTRTHQPR